MKRALIGALGGILFVLILCGIVAVMWGILLVSGALISLLAAHTDWSPYTYSVIRGIFLFLCAAAAIGAFANSCTDPNDY